MNKNYDLFGNEINDEKSKNRDWSGNTKAMFVCNGDSSHAKENREENDFYATEPRAVEELLERESFSKTILEPCVGKGHIANVLIKRGVRLYK